MKLISCLGEKKNGKSQVGLLSDCQYFAGTGWTTNVVWKTVKSPNWQISNQKQPQKGFSNVFFCFAFSLLYEVLFGFSGNKF